MKAVNIAEMPGTDVKTKVWGVPQWIVGAALILVAAGVSIFESFRMERGALLLPVGFIIGAYCLVLVARMLFLKMSSSVLDIGNAKWGSVMLVVGANAAFMMALTLASEIARIHGAYVTASLFILVVFFSFFTARKIFRISFLETLALYGLSLAMMLALFAIAALVFHVSLGSAILSA